MLEVSKRLHLLVVVAMTLTAAAFAGSVAAGSALAYGGHQESNETPPTLSGDWAALNRCPVDNPTMLAADGVTDIALCLGVQSPNGSLTIGGLTLPTKANDLQLGLVLNETDGSSTIVVPDGGAAVTESIEVPNGLQALICPSHGRLAWQVCRPPRHNGGDNEHSSQLTDLTVSMEPAGEPSGFSLAAGLSLNQPLLSLPVKIHLQNRLLGNRCYIGSNAEPIVIQPENITSPAVTFEAFDGNGTPDPSGPLTFIQLLNNQSSGSFAVPTASGCGFMGMFDEAIDNHMGLPSAAGKNSLAFNEAKTDLVALSSPETIAPNDGQELSKDWHSAVQPEENEGHHHRHGH